MTLQEANNFFESLKIETNKKSEIKIYDKFLHILNELKNRELSDDEIQSIEVELDVLNLEANQKNNKKRFNKKLKEFQEYLKEKHSLVLAGYYEKLGTSYGILFGVVVGVVFGERFEKSLGISLGISLGMIIGFGIGRYLDSQALAQGNVL